MKLEKASLVEGKESRMGQTGIERNKSYKDKLHSYRNTTAASAILFDALVWSGLQTLID